MEDLRSAKAAARHAGHHGMISFLSRGLLSRFAADARSSQALKQPPQKRKPLNHFIGARRGYEKLERGAADLFAAKKKRARGPADKKKTFETRILIRIALALIPILVLVRVLGLVLILIPGTNTKTNINTSANTNTDASIDIETSTGTSTNTSTNIWY